MITTHHISVYSAHNIKLETVTFGKVLIKEMSHFQEEVTFSK